MLRGGDSRDRIYGGTGDDTSYGENGNDLMAGGTRRRRPGRRRRATTASTRTSASTPPTAATATTTCGRWPAATSRGPGDVDQVGDTLDGGAGNDRFRTRDGEVDRITCGEGNDRAFLDDVDVITDATAENPNGSCEKVVRKDPKPSEAKSEDAQSNPADAQKQS